MRSDVKVHMKRAIVRLDFMTRENRNTALPLTFSVVYTGTVQAAPCPRGSEKPTAALQAIPKQKYYWDAECARSAAEIAAWKSGLHILLVWFKRWHEPV